MYSKECRYLAVVFHVPWPLKLIIELDTRMCCCTERNGPKPCVPAWRHRFSSLRSGRVIRVDLEAAHARSGVLRDVVMFAMEGSTESAKVVSD